MGLASIFSAFRGNGTGGLAGPLAAALLCSSAAFAEDVADPGFERGTAFQPRWNFSTEKAQTLTVSGGGTVSGGRTVRGTLARLWPADAVSIAVPVEELNRRKRLKQLVPANAAMIVLEGPAFVACEMARSQKSENIFTCLFDPERDGKFDYYSKEKVFSDFLLDEVKPNPKKLMILDNPIPYAPKNDWADDEKLTLQASLWWEKPIIYPDTLHLRFCLLESSFCLTNGVEAELDHLPIERFVFGSRVTLRGNEVLGFAMETEPMIQSGTTTFGRGGCEADVLFRSVRNCG